MGCNCKNDNKTTEVGDVENKNESPIFIKLLIILAKVPLFIIGSVIGSVIVIPFTIFLLYKSIFHNKSADVSNMLLYLAKPLIKKEEDYEEDETEFSTEDDVILLNEEKWYITNVRQY